MVHIVTTDMKFSYCAGTDMKPGYESEASGIARDEQACYFFTSLFCEVHMLAYTYIIHSRMAE